MSLYIDVSLSDEQKAKMQSIPATSWFTPVSWRNAAAVQHPDAALAENNDYKQELATDWITSTVEGKSVLDLFAANGAFSFLAARAGAKKVVGVEFSPDRVACAEFTASTMDVECDITFMCGDVYRIEEYFTEPFDVVLCLGGLYHVGDPAFILRQIAHLTRDTFILQTAQVLPYPGNVAKFRVRRTDKREQGLTSFREGYGTWHLTPTCLRELLRHAGFQVLAERRPPWHRRLRFPWYLAYCRAPSKTS